jgi:hypothetical protein
MEDNQTKRWVVMIESFNGFLSFLGDIKDPRRAEGKRYELDYLLLFVILAIVAGANSYRDIRTFIVTPQKAKPI